MKSSPRLGHLFLLLCIVTTNARALSIEGWVPVNVNIKFSTTINVSRSPDRNENSGAVEFAFQMQDQIFNVLESLKTNIDVFNIMGIKVYCPALREVDSVNFSVRFAYAESSRRNPVGIFYGTAIPGTYFKSGNYYLAGTSALTEFNQRLLEDIRRSSSERILKAPRFVVKIKVDGPRAALVDLEHLDLNVDIDALFVTSYFLEYHI